MPNLFERIRNVFTDEMLGSTEARQWTVDAVGDAKTEMAKELIGFAYLAAFDTQQEMRTSLTRLAVNFGASEEKLELGINKTVAAFPAAFDQESAEEAPEELYQRMRERGLEPGAISAEMDRVVQENPGITAPEMLRQYLDNPDSKLKPLPEELGLTVDQAATLAVINNLSQRGQTIDPETLCREARHAGIYEGSAADLAANIHALREAGMIKFSAAGEPSSVDVTDSGRDVATTNADRTRGELLAQLQDRRSELTEELERVIGSSRDAAAPGLAVPGFAEYLEAFNLLEQAELAVTSKVPLQISGDLMNEAAQVVEDYAADFAMAGITVDRTSEPKQDQKTEQKQEREQKQSVRKPQMQFAQGMRM